MEMGPLVEYLEENLYPSKYVYLIILKLVAVSRGTEASAKPENTLSCSRMASGGLQHLFALQSYSPGTKPNMEYIVK